jgi:hypothetical protein
MEQKLGDVAMIRLASGDWLWRPMMAGFCRYIEVLDGTSTWLISR